MNALKTAWGGLALALAASAALAQGPVPFNIPPQSLQGALDALAQQADLRLLYDPEAVAAQTSPGLIGTYTASQAIERLLKGTHLQPTFTAENTVAVKAARDDAPAEDNKEPPPSRAEEPTVLEEMTVTASPFDETSYNVPNATTATKTDTPIMETPMSIQVVPQQVLRDQQAIRLSDALKNVSGVQTGFAFTFRETFTVRGFDIGPGQYRDGFKVAESNFSLANAERIEVLKGPASVLFGRIEPGGLINIVTKRPLASPYYALEQQFGSFDTYRTTLDATGPITQDGTLAYRLNFEYLDQDSFRDFVAIDRKFVAPSLTWRLSGRTQIDLDFIYQDEDSVVDNGILAIGNRPAPIPIERSLGEEGFIDANSKTYDTALTLTHQFNEDWKLRGRFQAQLNDGFYGDVFALSLDEATGTLERFAAGQNYNSEVYFGTLDITGRVTTWGLVHSVLVGADYYDATYDELDVGRAEELAEPNQSEPRPLRVHSDQGLDRVQRIHQKMRLHLRP